MNPFFALALACTLRTAPIASDSIASDKTTTPVVAQKTAIWLTNAGKLRLSMGVQNARATIDLRDSHKLLYHRTVDLRAGLHQRFDLSQVDAGTYQIRVTVGREVMVKTIQIGSLEQRTVEFR